MRTLIIIALTFITALDANANYSEDLDNQRNVVREAFRRIQAAIRKFSKPQELIEINSATSVIIENADIPNIAVARNPNTRQIEIHTTPTFGLIVNYVSDVVTYSISNSAFFQCQIEYQEYLHSDLVKHGARINAGKSGIRFLAPEDYFNSIGSYECKKYAKAFPLADQLRLPRDNIMISILAFFYLHELGHIAKSHQGIYATSTGTSTSQKEQIREFSRLMSRSREQEYEADAWAVRTMINSGAGLNEIVSPALPAYLVVAGGFDCFFEASETHPNGYQRFSRIVAVAKNAYEDKYAQPLPDNVRAVFDDAIKLAEKARKKLNCDLKIPGIND